MPCLVAAAAVNNPLDSPTVLCADPLLPWPPWGPQ
uniref:Uncharacterized protein n=1 Tax=Arundo donax TaxID=35708 RepID=A0A0A9EHT9_ARUDO